MSFAPLSPPDPPPLPPDDPLPEHDAARLALAKWLHQRALDDEDYRQAIRLLTEYAAAMGRLAGTIAADAVNRRSAADAQSAA